MKCETVCEHLSAYLDGELSPELRTVVEDHLADCPACARQCEELRQTAALLGTLPRVNAPADLLAEINEYMARQSLLDHAAPAPPRPRRFRFITAAGSLAAAALILAVAWVTFYNPEMPAPTTNSSPRSDEIAGSAQHYEKRASGMLALSDRDRLENDETNQPGKLAEGKTSERAYLDAATNATLTGAPEIRIVLTSADPDLTRQTVEKTLARLDIRDRALADARVRGLAQTDLGTPEIAKKAGEQYRMTESPIVARSEVNKDVAESPATQPKQHAAEEAVSPKTELKAASTDPASRTEAERTIDQKEALQQNVASRPTPTDQTAMQQKNDSPECLVIQQNVLGSPGTQTGPQEIVLTMSLRELCVLLADIDDLKTGEQSSGYDTTRRKTLLGGQARGVSFSEGQAPAPKPAENEAESSSLDRLVRVVITVQPLPAADRNAAPTR